MGIRFGMHGEVTILGCGTSSGVPTVGCDCHVCTSDNPKNKRMRTSIFVEMDNGSKFLVDTSPDLRNQLLSNSITDLDFVIITHEHADHLHGIDDLRPLCWTPKQRSIPVYTSEKCLAKIRARFDYLFALKDRPVIGGGIPLLDFSILNENETTTIFDIPVLPITLPHGRTTTLGLLFPQMAYLVDCGHIDNKTLGQLNRARLELLILDCLKYDRHQTHLNVEKALHYAQKIQAKKTIFIHMAHDIEFEEFSIFLSSTYGDHLAPAYDGQKIRF